MYSSCIISITKGLLLSTNTYINMWSYLFLLLNRVENLTTLILRIALITHSLSLQTAKMRQYYLMLGTSTTKNLTTRPGGSACALWFQSKLLINVQHAPLIPAMVPSFDGSELCLAVEAFLCLVLWYPLHPFMYLVITRRLYKYQLVIILDAKFNSTLLTGKSSSSWVLSSEVSCWLVCSVSLAVISNSLGSFGRGLLTVIYNWGLIIHADTVLLL